MRLLDFKSMQIKEILKLNKDCYSVHLTTLKCLIILVIMTLAAPIEGFKILLIQHS